MFADLLLPNCKSREDFVARCEVFCRSLARRDLRGVPLYIIPNELLSADLAHACGDLGGYTGLETDAVARPFLPCWRGRGPAMVVSWEFAERYRFSEPYYNAATVWWERSCRAFFRVVLHELAHIFERGRLFWPYSGPMEEFTTGLKDWTITTLGRENAEPAAGPTAPIPWENHGAQFIRIALHLHYRAAKLLMFPENPPLAAGLYYGLSHPAEYSRALGDEPQRMIDRTFAEVKRSPLPGAFEELWGSDTSQQAAAQGGWGQQPIGSPCDTVAAVADAT